MEVTQDVEDKQLGEVPEDALSKVEETREEMLSRHRLFLDPLDVFDNLRIFILSCEFSVKFRSFCV